MSTDKNDNVRPWGFFEVLSDRNDFKVKLLTVIPRGRLSYQRHNKRAEHWFILKGVATVVLDGKEIRLSEKQSIDIPVHSWHRVKNDGKEDLKIVETQTGEYFGEDDIERKEDDYGRV